MQRHSDDADPASRERLSLEAHHGPIRPALCRKQTPREILRAGDPPLYQRPAAPHQISRGDLQIREQASRRAALERRANSGLVSTHREQADKGRTMNFPKPAVGMLPNDRLDYSAIPSRKALKLPGKARMVVWTITNVEEWDPTQTMPRTVLTPPAGGSPMPDIPNWCWHEYGNRVGFWRLLQVYDEFKIPGVMNINGVAVDAFPDIVKACVERKWEFIGHGYTQRNMQKVENERADIRKCIEVLEKTTGQKPRGWLGRSEEHTSELQ